MKKAVSMGMVILIGLLAFVPVYASSISEIKDQKNKTEEKIDSANEKIETIENEKNALSSEIKEMDEQLVNLMLIIEVLEDELKEKEAQIVKAQEEYEIAKKREEKQYEEMKLRIKFMYEKGDDLFIETLLESKSLSDMLNKSKYINDIYDYDKKLLEDYRIQRDEVKAKEQTLQNEKSEMEVMQAEYSNEKQNLEIKLEEKRKISENFEIQLKQVKEEVKKYQAALKEQTAKIRKLEEEKKKAEAAKKAAQSKNQASNPNSNSKPNPSAGVVSDGTKGSEIASFACQFIGNPYVAGGTSLTNGADCSGFTQSVFAHFGISLPRTSGSQALRGTSVSYSEARPGDIICYAGHVGIYIGGGNIVHASSPATGIKITNASYRTILAVRRYV